MRYLGEDEIIKEAASDPCVAMHDAYVQYRKKLIERCDLQQSSI
jgi:hypothetical protein